MGDFKHKILKMKLFKKLITANKEDSKEAIIGFGIPRAMDYEREKHGHLVLFSLHIKVVWFLAKIFIPL